LRVALESLPPGLDTERELLGLNACLVENEHLIVEPYAVFWFELPTSPAMP
jgi:hypothetical protein